MKAGINLFTLKKFISCEEDMIETSIALRDMGYSYLQFSGAPFDEGAIRKMVDASDLPVVLTHVPYDRIIGDTDGLMEAHDSFGCRRIGLGAMPRQLLLDEVSAKSAVDGLERVAEKMKSHGFEFFYHHHHFEFRRMGGETLFDYMVRCAPSIKFTVDTYWLQYGGVDVISTIERLRGRMDCIHLKDYGILPVTDSEGNVSFAPTFMPVGDGNMDFGSIVKAAEKSGARYYLVEQDNASASADPFGEVERSIRYIREEL